MKETNSELKSKPFRNLKKKIHPIIPIKFNND